MKSAKSTATNTAILAIGGIFRQFAFFAATAIFARKMAPEDFGVATLWYAVSLVLIGVADWGTRFTGWTTVAQKGLDAEAISSHLVTKIAMSALVTAALVVVISAYLFRTSSFGLLLPMAGLLFINQLTLEWIFRGLPDFATVLIMNLLSGIVLLGAAIRADDGAGTSTYLWAVLVSNFAAILYGSILLFYRGFRWRPVGLSKVIKMVSSASEYSLVSIVNRSYANFSILVLGVIALPVVVSSFRLSQMLFMFVSTLSYYVVGSIYSIYAAGGVSKDDFSRLLSRMFGLFVFMFVGSFIGSEYVAEPLIVTVFGSAYIDAIPMLKVMMWVLPFGFLGMFVREFAPALGVGKSMLGVTAAAIVIGAACISGLVYHDATVYLPAALGVADSVIIFFGSILIYRKFGAIRIES